MTQAVPDLGAVHWTAAVASTPLSPPEAQNDAVSGRPHCATVLVSDCLTSLAAMNAEDTQADAQLISGDDLNTSPSARLTACPFC